MESCFYIKKHSEMGPIIPQFIGGKVTFGDEKFIDIMELGADYVMVSTLG